MAAFPRLIITNISRNSHLLQQWGITQKITPVLGAAAVPTRNSSFLSSRPVRPLEEYPEVEVIYDAPEWKFVERILPPKLVPKPIAKSEYPSGWKLPTAGANIDQLKYFVSRTKNYMVPVYLKTTFRGQRRVTIVKRIQGNIWQLEKELRGEIEKTLDRRVLASRVNEMSGQIHFHGDHVDVVREYLKQKGL